MSLVVIMEAVVRARMEPLSKLGVGVSKSKFIDKHFLSRPSILCTFHHAV